MRWLNRDTALRLIVIVGLAATIYGGFMNTPEGASNLTPRRFYDNLVNDAEKTVMMREYFNDVLEATDKTVRVRLEELRSGAYTPAPGSLITEESLENALRKDQATRERVKDDKIRASEKLARAKALEASEWRMGLGCTPSAEVRP